MYRLIYGFVNDDPNILSRSSVSTLLTIYRNRESIFSELPFELIQIIIKCMLENNDVLPPLFKIYHPHLYSRPDTNQRYVGFDYGHVKNLYTDPPFVYAGELCLSTAKPPIEVIDICHELFSGIQMKQYALLQDVYTSHYANGCIAFGYWINNHYFETDEIHVGEHKLDFIVPAHTLEREATIFLGVILDWIVAVEDEDDSCQSVNTIHKPYYPVSLPSRDKIIKALKDGKLSPLPVLTFIPLNCHCCT